MFTVNTLMLRTYLHDQGVNLDTGMYVQLSKG